MRTSLRRALSGFNKQIPSISMVNAYHSINLSRLSHRVANEPPLSLEDRGEGFGAEA